jgi:dienelactone hydrolase
MRLIFLYSILFFVTVLPHRLVAQQTVTFSAKDGLMVTADLYIQNKALPYIVLCHLAGHSRGEYKETAKRLNLMGYNCLAVDARSGNEVMGMINQTAKQAKEQNKPAEFLDAEQDIVAAIAYADSLNKRKGVILLGSSYSAALALKIGTVDPKVRAVLSFSPGEYFGEKLNLKQHIRSFNKPLFVTSSKQEAPGVAMLISDIKPPVKQHFIPVGEGAHGSIALWKMTPNHAEYWTALEDFLKQLKS